MGFASFYCLLREQPSMLDNPLKNWKFAYGDCHKLVAYSVEFAEEACDNRTYSSDYCAWYQDFSSPCHKNNCLVISAELCS
jgi:hypothetical protein